MVSEWKNATLGELVRLQRGHDLTDSQRKAGEVPVMGSAGLNGYHNTSKAKGPGLVIGRSGASFGKVHYSICDYWPHNTALYVTDFLGNDTLFTFYFLRTIDFASYNSGSAQPSLNRNHIYLIPVEIPPLPEQKAIAHILGSLDDKIELNRRMNGTLEGMAQALFKSWFVDFDPVIDNALVAGNPLPDELAEGAGWAERIDARRQALATGRANRQAAQAFPAAFQFTEEMGWIPEGWEVKKLSDLLEVKYGKDHKKLGDGDIPVYGSGGLMRHADKSLYTGESVLIPRKGTLSNILYLNEEFWTVDTMFFTIPKGKFIPKYVFYHLKSLDFTSMNVGSAVPSMTTKVLNELPILMPAEAVLHDFDSILISYFDRIEANKTQSKTLATLRDTLLPKLISGELRIPDAEKLAEEALA